MQEIEHDFGFTPDFELAKDNLEKNDGAGNTFKATAKPVLVGTAVVGATTMIFSIVLELTHGLQPELLANLSILYPPFLLGMIAGGAVIYWFSGASIQAVTTGAYRAVEFIKENIKLGDSVEIGLDRRQHSSRGDLHRIRPGRNVQYLHCRLLFDARLRLFGTLSVHRLPGVDCPVRALPGHLHGQCRRGLGQCQESRGNGAQGQEYAAARGHVVGDTVGDPFKDTTSVALNPIIKFTTLFGLLAVPLAVSLKEKEGEHITLALAVVFLVTSMIFVHRSFYGMRIRVEGEKPHN